MCVLVIVQYHKHPFAANMANDYSSKDNVKSNFRLKEIGMIYGKRIKIYILGGIISEMGI